MAATQTDRRPVATDRQAIDLALRELIADLVDHRNPGGASAFIEGPPGIGKSHLIGHILEAAVEKRSRDRLTVLRAARIIVVAMFRSPPSNSSPGPPRTGPTPPTS